MLSACSQPQNSRTRNNQSSAGWAWFQRSNTWGEPSGRRLGSGVRSGARIGIVNIAWVLMFLCYLFRVLFPSDPTHPRQCTFFRSFTFRSTTGRSFTPADLFVSNAPPAGRAGLTAEYCISLFRQWVSVHADVVRNSLLL